MCVCNIFDLVTTSLDAIFLPMLCVTLEPFSRGKHSWTQQRRVLLQAETRLSHRQQCTNIMLLTLTKIKIYTGSKRNPKYQIPTLETEKMKSVPPSSTSGKHPLSYLQLQEGDVEELVQVLEAKAVLHGRLSIAKIRGAGRPVSTR